MTTGTIDQAVERIARQMVDDRRYLHQHPELGFEEENTARLVAERLRALGLEVQTGVAKTGVVGLLRGGRPGKTVLLRADMDALPIEEENDVAYRSQTAGTMHACGHDGHTSILLGVAEVLSGMRDEIPGTVKLVFQPAEEGLGGARQMIEAGVLENPHVDACFGLHLWQELPVGMVGVRSGPLMAASDRFFATITGTGGHAAMPHLTVDATLIACEAVVALQTLVSREVNPLRSAVVTVGKLHAGTTANVIAGRAEIAGTCRSFDRDVRQQLAERVPALIKEVAAALRGRAEVEFRFGVPATINDATMTEIARGAATEVVGADHVVEPAQTMGGEDMSLFLERAPGCFLFVGSANAGTGKTFGHHHPRFDIDEQALTIGAETLVRTALAYLSEAR